jgi:hypothetical protein
MAYFDYNEYVNKFYSIKFYHTYFIKKFSWSRA